MDTTRAAEVAEVTVATVRAWCRYGAVQATKTGGRWDVDAASLSARLTIGRRGRRDADLRGIRRGDITGITYQRDGQTRTVGGKVVACDGTAVAVRDHSTGRKVLVWGAEIRAARREQERAELAAYRAANRATEAQVRGAIFRLSHFDLPRWQNTDVGDSKPLPTREDLAAMSKYEISDLISYLDEELGNLY